MTMEQHRITPEKWRAAWYWYRGAPHQVDAVNKLYLAIQEADPCLLSEHSEWFQRYRDRDKLIHSFMHTDGE